MPGRKSSADSTSERSRAAAGPRGSKVAGSNELVEDVAEGGDARAQFDGQRLQGAGASLSSRACFLLDRRVGRQPGPRQHALGHAIALRVNGPRVQWIISVADAQNPADCSNAFGPSPGTCRSAVRPGNGPCASRWATMAPASFGPILATWPAGRARRC